MLERHRIRFGVRGWRRLVFTVGFCAFILLTPRLVTHPTNDPPSSGMEPSLGSAPRSVLVTLRRGETLMTILTRFGLERSQAHAMI